MAAAASSTVFREATRVVGIPFASETSGEMEAARIEQRSSSLFWDLDDLEWKEVVVPVVDRLRAMGPDLQTREQTHEMLVLEKS